MSKIHSFQASVFKDNGGFHVRGLVVTNKEHTARVCDVIIDNLRERYRDDDVVVDKLTLVASASQFVEPALVDDGVYVL